MRRPRRLHRGMRGIPGAPAGVSGPVIEASGAAPRVLGPPPLPVPAVGAESTAIVAAPVLVPVGVGCTRSKPTAAAFTSIWVAHLIDLLKWGAAVACGLVPRCRYRCVRIVDDCCPPGVLLWILLCVRVYVRMGCGLHRTSRNL